jgi:hypothetical protein
VIRPNPGELLDGICRSLRTSVLGALPPGDAQRQLRAALHALGRLQRSWDLLPACLQADNDDMRATLQAILDAVLPGQTESLPALATIAADLVRLSTPAGAATVADQHVGVPGIHDAALAAAARTNAALQAMLIDIDRWLRASDASRPGRHAAQFEALNQLYLRMTQRELHATAAEDVES